MFNALKRKRFEDSDDDDDDDDDIDPFETKKSTRKSNKVIIKQSLYNTKKDTSSIKETKSNILDDSDVEVINDSKSNSPITTNGNTIKNAAEVEAQRVIKSIIAETIDITKSDTTTTTTTSSSSSSNQNSKKAEEIEKILNEIKKKKVIYLVIIHIIIIIIIIS